MKKDIAKVEMLAELMTIGEILKDILETDDKDIKDLMIARLGLHVNLEAKKLIEELEL